MRRNPDQVRAIRACGVDSGPRGIRVVPAFEGDALTVRRPRLRHEIERLIRPRQQVADAHLVTAGPGDAGPNFPALSPDGTRIAYLKQVSLAGPVERYLLELWAADIDGGEPSRILNFRCCLRDWNAPTWSDDGEYIAIGFAVSVPRAGSGVAVVRSDGSDLRFISESNLEPDWLPIPASDD